MLKVLAFFYNYLWTACLVVSLPVLPFARKWLPPERFFLRMSASVMTRKRIWMHALSVGEVISALPIVYALKHRFPAMSIAFTVKTAQGLEIARKELENEVDEIFQMPLDFWWSMQRVVKHIRPSIFLLIETDIWPGLLFYLNNRGIPTFLVNGRISPRTFRGYMHIRYLTQTVLNCFDLCLMQSDIDSDRLDAVGVSRKKIRTVGNIKFDRSWVRLNGKEREDLISTLKFQPDDRIWIAGSTHEGEEETILDTYQALLPSFSHLRLLIAPRRIERADEIQDICVQRGLRAVRKSAIAHMNEPFQVLILDTIGELGHLYGIADISFVGGSLVPRGGHNLLEPASFGCPVLFGASLYNFSHMAESLLEAGGGEQVSGREDLYLAVRRLLTDPDRAKKMGNHARTFVETNQGALNRIMKHIDEALNAA